MCIRDRYIVVKIGNEQYGIDISYVDNIVRMQKITRVPRVQNFFKGIINLRGEIVPVMSLRIRMELEEDVFTNASRIIILKIEQQSALGIIVDEVKEVVTLGTNEIDKVSGDMKNAKVSFIDGIGTVSYTHLRQLCGCILRNSPRTISKTSLWCLIMKWNQMWNYNQ